MKIKEYNQMKEELIKDDRGDSTGAFRNFVREQRALDQEPRTMELASGYGSSTFDAHKKREAAFKAYKEYKKSYYGSRQRNPILTFRQFLPIYAKENYAEGGRIGFNDGKNVFLNEGKKSKFTAGAETTVINGKEYVKITKLGNPNFGKYVYKTSVAAPGYGRSGKSKNEYLTYDQLVKRINKPKTGKAPFKSYTKEYTQSLKDIKAYVKSQGGAKKVYLSDLVEMFGDPTATETGRDVTTETKIEKALGIKMGEPYFKAKDIIIKNNVHVFSSNYSLYGDLSRRVMRTLKRFNSDIEVYSIDEAFIDLSNFPDNEVENVTQEIRATVLQWTGIPTSVGIAKTKTLSKVANHIAKKTKSGIVSLIGVEDIDPILEKVEVNDIWGVGKQLTKFFIKNGIHNAKQLKNISNTWIKKNSNVLSSRNAMQLRGIS